MALPVNAKPVQPGTPDNPGQSTQIGNTSAVNVLGDDAALLRLYNRCKDEAFADRWIFERQWTRIIHYLNHRQWLAPYSRTEGWREARLAKGIPRPTTSKVKEADQAIRAMFTAIKFGVVIRPASQNQKSIMTAQTCDDLAPLLHDLHDMDGIMHEGDFWFVNLGNVIYHSCWDYNAPYGSVSIPIEACLGCKQEFSAVDIKNAGQKCPGCGGVAFTAAMDAMGRPKQKRQFQGGAVTRAISPLECAFPMTHARWSDVPFLIEMRWREKRYYEENPSLKKYVDGSDNTQPLKFSKSPSDRSLQIFQSLPFQNDMPSSRYSTTETTNSQEAEGISEYTLWMRPTPEHPEGLVLRVAGDTSPTIIHSEEDEGVPGELPYHDVKGNPLFTFAHAGYQHVGGRVIASGAHDPVMSKYDQLNRIDSLTEMIVMRMASPQWMLPKGSNVQWLGDSPGLPGLLLQWDAQVAGAAGRPERIPGVGVDASISVLREQIVKEIEDGLGTYDIIRGAKPTGVEAFSALQLLVERGQQRFANAFLSRGKAYRDWIGFALELEREFGPDTRVLAVMSPNKTWGFQTFKKADLRGDVTIVIEDGTYTPKTSLGERAAVEHLKQLGFIQPNDTEQTFVIFQKFGQTSLMPGLNAHVEAARKKQEDFETWMASGAFKRANPEAIAFGADPTYPLKWRPWYAPEVHRAEFLKWANSDSIQRMILQYPQAEGLLTAHLMEIDNAIMQKQMGTLDPQGNAALKPAGGGSTDAAAAAGASAAAPSTGAGAGMAMANSNQNSGALSSMPGGPAMSGASAPM